MEKGAYPGPSGSVIAYSAAPEDIQQTDIDGRRTLDLYHATSSSPDLSLKIKPSLPDLRVADLSLSRTRTLPLRSPKRGPSFFPTLQGITFEVENLERLRCWVLGLAIGNFFAFWSSLTRCVLIHFISVDFDLEQGPSLSCIFPPLPLYPFEAENMFVLFTARWVLAEVELELVPSLHFLIQRHSRKARRHIPSVFENRFREQIKRVLLSLILDVPHLQMASFTASRILIKRKAPLPNADTLRYAASLYDYIFSSPFFPEVHRGLDTSPISSTILYLTKQVRAPLSNPW